MRLFQAPPDTSRQPSLGQPLSLRFALHGLRALDQILLRSPSRVQKRFHVEACPRSVLDWFQKDERGGASAWASTS